MTDPKDLALRYASAGFPVFPIHWVKAPAPPSVVAAFKAGELSKKEAVAYAQCSCGSAECRSPGKHPLIGNGVNGASTEPEQIEAWFEQWPEAYVGIRMPAGMFAVDFDDYVPGVAERRAALELAGLPPTMRQASGAGGVHLIFKGAPEDFAFATTLDAQSGVDIIHNAHRYLVAAPSGHWTGGVYEWLNDLEPAAAPDWLLKRCARGARPAPKERKASERGDAGPSRRYDGVRPPQASAPARPANVDPHAWGVHLALTLPPAISDDEEGSTEHGHVTLARTASILINVNGLSPEAALDLLWDNYNPRCIPPWDDSDEERHDFERTVLKVAPRRELEQTPAAESAEPGEAVSVLGVVADLGTEPEPIAYICEGLGLGPGKISGIGGYAGLGKGPAASELALSFASGQRAFERYEVKRCRVALVDFETGRLAETRLKRLARVKGLDLEQLQREGWLRLIHGRAPISEEWLAAFEELVKGEGIGCAVIDSYTSAVGGDQNESTYADVAFRLGALSSAHDLTVLAVLHEKKRQAMKRGGSDLEMVSGHNALAAALQSAISLSRPDDEDRDLVEVRCARAPEDSFKAFCIRWEDVPDPKVREGTTPGARTAAARAHKWGLKACWSEVPELLSTKKVATSATITAQMAAIAPTVIDVLSTHAPTGEPFAIKELKDLLEKKEAYVKRACDQLVREGRLLGDYIVGTSGKGKPQHVWLPGRSDSPVGLVQRSADKKRR